MRPLSPCVPSCLSKTCRLSSNRLNAVKYFFTLVHSVAEHHFSKTNNFVMDNTRRASEPGSVPTASYYALTASDSIGCKSLKERPVENIPLLSSPESSPASLSGRASSTQSEDSAASRPPMEVLCIVLATCATILFILSLVSNLSINNLT